MNFHIRKESLSESLILLRLEGEDDLSAAPELKGCVDAVIDLGATKLIMDLSAATYIDATTLGILIGTLKRLRRRGGNLAVVCPDPGMARIFSITGLDRMFLVEPTLEAAVTALEVDVGLT